MVGLLSTKKEVWSGVNIIHHYSEDMFVSVTGCHHRQTDPQNLWKQKNMIVKIRLRNSWRTKHRPYFKCFWHSLIKQRYRRRGLERCRVIKVKGSGNALAEESAQRPSCASDSLWGQRSAQNCMNMHGIMCHILRFCRQPSFDSLRSSLWKDKLSFVTIVKPFSMYCIWCEA